MNKIKKRDCSDFLKDGEIPVLNIKAEKDKRLYAEIALLAVLAFGTVAGDCFLIGAAFWTSYVKVSQSYLTIFIPCLFVHLIPLGVWAYFLFSKMAKLSSLTYLFCDNRLIAAYFTDNTATATIIKYKSVTGYIQKKHLVKLYLGEDVFTISGLSDSSAAVKLIEEKTASESGGNEISESAAPDTNTISDCVGKQNSPEATGATVFGGNDAGETGERANKDGE